jgi:hypothetical protein
MARVTGITGVSVSRPALLLTATHVVLLSGASAAAALPLATATLHEDRVCRAVRLYGADGRVWVRYGGSGSGGEAAVELAITLGDVAWLALMPPLRAAMAAPRAGDRLARLAC